MYGIKNSLMAFGEPKKKKKHPRLMLRNVVKYNMYLLYVFLHGKVFSLLHFYFIKIQLFFLQLL